MWAAPVGICAKSAASSAGACWGLSRIFMDVHGYMVHDIETILKVNLCFLLYKLMVYVENRNSPAVSVAFSRI